MKETEASRVRARFHRYTVDLSSGELLRDEERVPIQEKPLQVLRLLLESEGAVVTRDHLRSALWSEDTFVDFEHGVNTAVKKLRRALEDSVEHPKFVETLPRYGYRFLAPVEWLNSGNADPPTEILTEPGERATVLPNPPDGDRKIKAVLTLAGLILVLLAVLFSDRLGLVRTMREVADERRVEAQTPVTQRKLTANPDEMALTAGVLSPDGKYLAYSDPSGFYLKHVDSGETHRVTFPPGFEPMPEGWFPDSVHLVVRWISEASKGSPSLWKISILGGEPRKLADAGSSARVSPDGTKIAYLAGIWDNEQIWLMQADGSHIRKLIDGGQRGFGAVAWAPDSKRFAYVRSNDDLRPNGRAIELYDLTSGDRKVVLEDVRLGDELAWGSSGRLIYTLREPEPNWEDLNLWSTQVDAKMGLSSGAPIRITNDHNHIAGISLTVDGKRLAVRRTAFQPDVFISDIGANDKRLSEPRRLTLDERWDWPSAWTPDSKAVVFNSDRDGPNRIYKQRIDATQPELLVGAPDVLWLGQVTPDGQDLIYATTADSRQPTGKVRLMRIPLAGGPSKAVLESEAIRGYQCARSPAELCVYGQMDDKSEFYRFFAFDPSGVKPPKELARIKKEDGPNQWNLSPNGKFLVMRKTQDPYQTPEMRIFDLTRGTVRDVAVPGVGLMMGMDWAVDSQSIWLSAYMGRGAFGSRSALLKVDLNGKARVLMEKQNFDLWTAVPSPDGKHLALLGHTHSCNMSLLEGF